MPQPARYYFMVGDPPNARFGYGWRVGVGRTSFYIKPMEAALSGLKISLHGPDEQPGIGPAGFKVEQDESASRAVAAAGGAYQWAERWPNQVWFPGRPVAREVWHVMRIRSSWEMFAKAGSSAPAPRTHAPKANAEYHGLPAPGRLRATDVDLYVSRRRPYIPRRAAASRDNAILRTLTNDAGEHLTGVVTERSSVDVPAPEPLRMTVPPDPVRGCGVTLDPGGFLWVCELWLSRAVLTDEPAA